MANFYVHKVAALPGTLQANSIYMVSDAVAGFMEFYVTNSAGTATRRIPTKSDIDGWISTAVASLGSIVVVANIAARDAVTAVTGTTAMVLDATADPTVATGAATYVWNGTTWDKISEAESLDVIVDWATITNKPASVVADIDDAVTKRHVHVNMAVLNKMSEDADGDLNYDGAFVRTGWDATDW